MQAAAALIRTDGKPTDTKDKESDQRVHVAIKGLKKLGLGLAEKMKSSSDENEKTVNSSQSPTRRVLSKEHGSD